jgi:hypothetical protein
MPEIIESAGTNWGLCMRIADSDFAGLGRRVCGTVPDLHEPPGTDRLVFECPHCGVVVGDIELTGDIATYE